MEIIAEMGAISHGSNVSNIFQSLPFFHYFFCAVN
jgi:hypothetical protein